jgi:hypothetical protein
MRCPRCQGCFYTNCEQEQSCINCGFYLFPPDLPEALTMDPARWQSVLCARCNVVPAIYKRELCPKCQDARHQRQGYGHQKVTKGF